MIGTPSQYSQSKLVGLHSPTRLDKGEYFLSIEGIGSLYVLKRNGDYIIRDVFVLPEHRGKGYGQKMLEEIIAFLKQKKKKIYLYVDPANEIAITLYKKVGFQLLKANDKHGDKFIYKA
jgi:RimJ/RimL family protein N-acetyltransferase